MLIIKNGSTRADLLGGTLDIWPINLILPQVYTINVALELKAQVKFSHHAGTGIKIISHDYQQEYLFSCDQCRYANLGAKLFGPMSLMMRLLLYWQPAVEKLDGLQIELHSGAPAGSGLGGSSAMAITFMQAVREYLKLELGDTQLLEFVMAQEAIELGLGPTGYQDYYPALYGGVLALEANALGVKPHQLFNVELKVFLEQNVSLVYSGQSRFSAINNWEVYKAFFDKEEKVRQGLTSLAKLSMQAYQTLQQQNYNEFLHLIAEEGKERRQLFHNIETEQMQLLIKDLQRLNTNISIKVCGAGGGGCFLLLHPQVAREEIIPFINRHRMSLLDFSISTPIGQNKEI